MVLDSFSTIPTTIKISKEIEKLNRASLIISPIGLISDTKFINLVDAQKRYNSTLYKEVYQTSINGKIYLSFSNYNFIPVINGYVIKKETKNSIIYYYVFVNKEGQLLNLVPLGNL